MDYNLSIFYDHKDLVSFLDDHFSSEDKTPVFIMSKPFSGRTSTIEEVAQSHKIQQRDLIFRHVYADVYGRSVSENKAKGTFDDWAEAYLAEQNIDTEMFVFIEVDPGWMASTPDGQDLILADYYQSMNYKCIIYIPTVDDWLVWAQKSNHILPEIIEFAKEYPSFYSLEHNIYGRLNMKLDSLIEEGAISTNRAKSHASEFKCIQYSGFKYRISQPICELFVSFMKKTRFKEAFELMDA